MEFNFGTGPHKGRRKGTKKSRRSKHQNRREVLRADAQDRRLDNDRRENERRHEAAKRKAVAVLKALEMQKAAQLVAQTAMIEPLVTILSFIFSGAINFSIGGFGGIAALVALVPHEFGHFHAVLRMGYRPHLFRFWPFGAIMKLPEMTSKSHKAHIAFGGPFYGLLFTICTTVIWLIATNGSSGTETGVSHNLFTLALVSLIINLFNLIPLRPLDGGWIVHGMDGVWPKWLTRLGYLILLVITVRFLFSTVFVVWILVVGYMSPAKWLSRKMNVRKWRYIISFLLTLLLVVWIHHDHILKAWTLATALGEAASVIIAMLFTFRYERTWRFPERYPDDDTERESVDPREGKSMRVKAFALFFALLANLAVLFFAL